MKPVYILEGACYVLLHTNAIHPIAHDRFLFLWYPETSKTLLGCINYKPYEQSIVTENPWLIAMYDRENVFVWRDGKWRNPNHQTYGGDISHIMTEVLKIPNMIPAQALDGGRIITKFKSSLEDSYI
jgi:hypothetical protein